MPGPKALLSEALILDSDSDPNVDRATTAAKKPASKAQKLSQSAEQNPTKKRKHGGLNASSTGPSVKHAAIAEPQSKQTREKDGSESHSISSRDEDEDESGSDDSASETELCRRTPVTTSSSTPVPAAPYKPPAGFELATVMPQHVLNKESLHGKHIWYITAPASVPLSLIKDVPIRNGTARASVLSYKTAEYGLIEEPHNENGEKLLLVPSPKKNGYRHSGIHIEKTFHLQQLVELPASAQRNRLAGNGAITAPKTHVKMVRQQPEGLRMRYHPFGDQSSSEDTDEAPRFKLPPMNSAELSPRAERPSTDNAKLSPLKAGLKKGKSQKKGKLPSIVSEASALSSGSIPNQSTEMIRLESQSNHRLSSSPKPMETSEEKAKRRAEKKRRREMMDDEPNQTLDKREEHAQSRTYERKQLTANGINGIDRKSPEEATPKKKRKKRKSEATDMP